MTGLANIRSADVTIRQTVTTAAGTGAIHLGVVDGKHRCPTCGAMTRFTDVR